MNQQSDKPIIDVLMDRERIRGAARMLPEGINPDTITEAQAKQIAHEVNLFATQQGLGRREVARAIGYKSPGVISEFIKGTYAGNWRQLAIDLDAWLDAEQKRVNSAIGGPQFVWTEVAREIQTVASLVIQLRTIGLVYGPDTAGIGKTMALQAIHQETPGSLFVTCDKIEANPTGLLRGIAHALRINDNGRNASIYKRVKEMLKGTPRLLIIDQIHNLRRAKDDKPLYILADLYDATKSPQLWCGTADMVSYLTTGVGKGDESLAQIRSRITYVRDLMQRCADGKDGGRGEPLYTVDNIREVFAKNKIRLTTAAVQMLYKLACIPDSGALRTCRNLVLIATITAEQLKMTSIDAPLLLAALRDSVQKETFDTLYTSLRQQMPAMAKVG
jgi:hypothetical protein